jgi:hypothetical protein
VSGVERLKIWNWNQCSAWAICFRHRPESVVQETEESILRTARKKLNELNVAGAVGAGGIVGLLTGSWIVFAVVSAVLIAAGIGSGNIRLDRKNRQR